MTFVIFKTIDSFEKVKQPIEDQWKFFETFWGVIWILKCSDKIFIVFDFTEQEAKAQGNTLLKDFILKGLHLVINLRLALHSQLGYY